MDDGAKCVTPCKREWGDGRDSNPRPPEPQSSALPIALPSPSLSLAYWGVPSKGRIQLFSWQMLYVVSRAYADCHAKLHVVQSLFAYYLFVYYGAEDGIRTRVTTLARSYPCPDWKTSADYGHNVGSATARDDDDGAGGQCWIRTSDAPRDAYPPSKRAD